MKKYLLMLLVVLFTVILFGCSAKTYYRHSNPILEYNLSEKYVEFNVNDYFNGIYYFYPQDNLFIVKWATHNISHKPIIFQIEDSEINSISPDFNRKIVLFLKKSDIEKIYSYYNLSIPKNIEILNENLEPLKFEVKNTQVQSKIIDKKQDNTNNINNTNKNIFIIIIVIIIVIIIGFIIRKNYILRINQIKKDHNFKIDEYENKIQEYKQLLEEYEEYKANEISSPLRKIYKLKDDKIAN